MAQGHAGQRHGAALCPRRGARAEERLRVAPARTVRSYAVLRLGPALPCAAVGAAMGGHGRPLPAYSVHSAVCTVCTVCAAIYRRLAQLCTVCTVCTVFAAIYCRPAQPCAGVSQGLISPGPTLLFCIVLRHRCALPCVAALCRAAPSMCCAPRRRLASLLLCDDVRRRPPRLSTRTGETLAARCYRSSAVIYVTHSSPIGEENTDLCVPFFVAWKKSYSLAYVASISPFLRTASKPNVIYEVADGRRLLRVPLLSINSAFPHHFSPGQKLGMMRLVRDIVCNRKDDFT